MGLYAMEVRHTGFPIRASFYPNASFMNADTYLVDRIDEQLDWLSSSSKKNKQAYMRYRISGILLGALITVLAPYAGTQSAISRWVPPVLQIAGAGVAIVGSLLALNQHQENWLRYRLLKESLEREKMLYLTGSLEAYGSGGEDAFHEFVRRAEAIMAEERTAWSSQISEQTRSQQNAATLPPGNPPPEQADTSIASDSQETG